MSTSSMVLPCIAFHSVDDRSTLLFSASAKKPILGGEIDELENKIICPTTHGFMLARDPVSEATFLWSPQSRAKIELPPLPEEVDDDLLVDCTCLLSSNPSAPDCVVLLAEPDAPFIWYCRVRDSNWEDHEYDIGTQPLPGCDPPEEKIVICQIAVCRGKFYFNGMSTSLGVMDFSGGAAPVFSSIAIDRTMDENYGYERARAKVFLLESDDDLYMVRLLCAGDKKPYLGATVHMMEFSTRRWRRVDDLSGRTFLLGMYEFGASIEGGESGLQQNCVYFMDNPQRKRLQIFSAKDGRAELQEFDDAPMASDKAFWMISADQ